MAEVAHGIPAAQRAAVRRLLPRVERLCRALLRNREDSEDAAQLSVLEILKSAGSFRGESSLERWADRLTARTALRSVQAERRAHKLPVDMEPPHTLDGTGESALLAQQYLDRLSERQRSVLLLRHAFELSIDEIAELIGISPNTVKDRLLRARSTLRQMVRNDALACAPRSKPLVENRESAQRERDGHAARSRSAGRTAK